MQQDTCYWRCPLNPLATRARLHRAPRLEQLVILFGFVAASLPPDDCPCLLLQGQGLASCECYTIKDQTMRKLRTTNV